MFRNSSRLLCWSDYITSVKQTWVDDIGVTVACLISSNRNPNLGLSSGQGQMGPFPVILGPVINLWAFPVIWYLMSMGLKICELK